MRTGKHLFTSESVSEGHPDKVCDRISDAIVDTFLAQDTQSRVAVETLTTTNRIVLAGEVRGPAAITTEVLEEVVRSGASTSTSPIPWPSARLLSSYAPTTRSPIRVFGGGSSI